MQRRLFHDHRVWPGINAESRPCDAGAGQQHAQGGFRCRRRSSGPRHGGSCRASRRFWISKELELWRRWPSSDKDTTRSSQWPRFMPPAWGFQPRPTASIVGCGPPQLRYRSPGYPILRHGTIALPGCLQVQIQVAVHARHVSHCETRRSLYHRHVILMADRCRPTDRAVEDQSPGNPWCSA